MKKIALLLSFSPLMSTAQKFDFGINAGVNRMLSNDVINAPNYKNGGIYNMTASIQPNSFKFGLGLDIMQPGGKDVRMYGHPAWVPHIMADYVINLKNADLYFGLRYSKYYSSEKETRVWESIYTARGDVAGIDAGCNIRAFRDFYLNANVCFNRAFINMDAKGRDPASIYGPASTFSLRGDGPEVLNFGLLTAGVHYEMGHYKKHNRNHTYVIPSVADELIKLKKLKDDGAITNDEYEAQKKKLLSQ